MNSLKKFFLPLVVLLLLAAWTKPAISAPIEVLLRDALSHSPLKYIKVTAKEILPDGKLEWTDSATTDENGIALFDLDGLGSGKVFRFTARVFNDVPSMSTPVSRPGRLVFDVGKLKITLVSGADGARLPNYKVVLKEVTPEGKYEWSASAKTDASAVVRFDPEGLGSGRTYVVSAKSPQDGSTKYSPSFSSPGSYTFQVGGRPLVARVKNGLSNEPLAGLKVTAVKVTREGKTKWAASRTTDENGTAVFDLDGLGSGTVYRLYCKPYNGGTVYSKDITAPGPFEFRVGLIPVLLRHRYTGRPLSGVKLVLYSLKEDGKLKWLKSGTTDGQGLVIFDSRDLGSGTRLVVRADKPFNDKKRYYSPWIAGPGQVDFAIDETNDYSLDLEPPWIGFVSPSEDAPVPATGFDVALKVTDNQEVSRVWLLVGSQEEASPAIQATYDDAADAWIARIEEGLSPGAPLRITALATDRARNSSSAVVTVQPVADSAAPVVTFAAPAGGRIERHGFVVSGNVTDETAVSTISVSLSCPESGESVFKEAFFDLGAHTWIASFGRDELPGCTRLQIGVTANDVSGNSGTRTFSVETYDAEPNLLQLLNRITFGITPRLLWQVSSSGPEQYLSAQLRPETVDDSWFERNFADYEIEDKYDLIYMQLLRSIYSRRQLLEVMTWFWENHFNTDITRHYHVEYELEENRLFRKNALGRFRDLLLVSATSPAMLYYLDNVSNRKESPNENYAREIMELHTLGVDNGYTQQDIVEAARCFTGWRVKDGQFYFDPRRHDYGEKRVLGHVIPAGQGMEDGLQVIDILASHPNTASFVCRKLAVYLVDDDPPDSLIVECAKIFQASDGDIARIVDMLLHSDPFNDSAHFHDKVKTPLEFVVGLVRNLGAEPSLEHLKRTLDVLGMRPFFYPFPTGWPERGEKWVNSDQYLQRLRFIGQTVFNTDKDKYCRVDVKKFFSDAGLSSPQEMVDYLLTAALSGDYTPTERQNAMDLLNYGTEGGFSMDLPDAETRLRRLLMLVLSYPEYQLQ